MDSEINIAMVCQGYGRRAGTGSRYGYRISEGFQSTGSIAACTFWSEVCGPRGTRSEYSTSCEVKIQRTAIILDDERGPDARG